jgi:hypothetical protein
MEAAKQDTAQLKIVGGLLVVFVLVVGKSLGLFPKGKPPEPAVAAPAVATAPTQELAAGQAGAETAVAEDAGVAVQIARNPFVPQLPPVEHETPATPETATPGAGEDGAEPALGQVDIQGLIWGGLRPQAIINNRLYQVGDKVGGGTIESIERGRVIIRVGKKKVTLGPKTASPVTVKGKRR